MKPGDIIPLTIEKPAAGGAMIARHEGQVVLVAGAIPGERVQARLARVTKSVAHAEVVAIEEPSPDRRAVSGDPLCGGCLYSHIGYARQLAIKSDVIADAFRRIGHIELAVPVGVAPSPEDGYRMRARLHVRGSRFGFFREGTHDLCDARTTRQLLPATMDALERLMAAVRSTGPGVVREIELSENLDASERVAHLDTSEALDPRLVDKLLSVDGFTAGPYVTDAVTIGDASLKLRRHVQSFFQGNRYLLRDLVAHVIDRVPIDSPVLDLYAGVGLFAVAAAVIRGARVTAVEGDARAAADLQANGQAIGGTMTTVQAPVESVGGTGAGVFSVSAVPDMKAGTVIVDPPRTGMSREALDAVLRVNAARLIYVSCDAATLARDARRIVDAGHTIERADAFDMFPNTPHVETVIVFRRS
ncbi:MAG TPA: TRAM domain-containing protein [Vicinamibacterales bacterium]|nr:TRAM domain-containing protein [Vicinamibacterales bacterium]